MQRAIAAAGLIATAAAVAAPARAQQAIGYYCAWLGPEDFVSSRGVRLTSLPAIIQQDRANFHRFGIRHEADMDDPWFGSQEARAAIPGLYRRDLSDPGIERAVMSGTMRYVLVTLHGTGGAVTALSVDYCAG